MHVSETNPLNPFVYGLDWPLRAPERASPIRLVLFEKYFFQNLLTSNAMNLVRILYNLNLTYKMLDFKIHGRRVQEVYYRLAR